jgi:hypothetical protein
MCKHNSEWWYREDVHKFQWDTSDWYALECTLWENMEASC